MQLSLLQILLISSSRTDLQFRRGCLDWLGYLPYTQVVMGSNPIPSIYYSPAPERTDGSGTGHVMKVGWMPRYLFRMQYLRSDWVLIHDILQYALLIGNCFVNSYLLFSNQTW